MKNQTTQRYSKQREHILRALRDTTSHPTASWIYDKVRDEIPNISLGTVYRNLARLCNDELILKLDVGDGTERYDGNIESHYHLFCKECGRVCDIGIQYEDKLDRRTEFECGCKIDYHNLIFCGVCAKCRNKTEK